MKRGLLKGFLLGILLLMIPLLAAADENGNCGENLNWNLSNQGVLTISGTGAMFNYSSFSFPTWQQQSFPSVTDIIINEGVTSIGDSAFERYSGIIASIRLPSTLTYIGTNAFPYPSETCSIEYNGTGSDWDSKVTKKDGNSALAVDKIHFAACTSHAFGDWTQTSEPTCTDAGVETRCCSRCNTTETRPVAALGHNMTKTDSKAATCTEDGNPEYWTCSRCSKHFHDYQGSDEFSDQESIVISALGHDFGEWTRTTEPTCTNTGVETRECSRCHATETRSVEALNHIFSEWTQTTAPTCTETGEKTRECTRCHMTETQSVAALGHNIIHYEAQTATCLTDGWDAYDACTRQDCDYSTKAVIPALNHDFSEWTQTTDPTCTAAGEKNRHCSRCDFCETQPIAALGHNPVYHEAVSAQCLTDGNIEYWTCSRCSGFFSDFACSIPITAEATVTGKLGHDFRNWTVTTPATCLTDGIETATCSRCTAANTRSVKKPGHNPVHHEAVSAQCLTDGNIEYWTCSRCSGIFSDSSCETSISANETISQQLGHDLGEWVQTTEPTCTEEGIETRYCSRCEFAETRPVDALGHDLTRTDLKSPTCTEPGNPEYWTCSRCSKHFHNKDGTYEFTEQESIVTAALGHDFGKWSQINAPTCTTAGLKTHHCSRCNITETESVNPLGHIFVPHAAKAPTCKNIGWNAYETCSRCDYSSYQEIPPTTQHTPGQTVEEIIKDATCTHTGRTDTVVYCSVCGMELIRTIKTVERLAHDYGLWTVTVEPTCTAAGEKTHKCSICDTTETQPVDALGHAFNEWILTTSPTCTTNGEQTRYCSRCDAVETRPVNTLGHDLIRTDLKSPTSTETGNPEYWNCSRCTKHFQDEECTHECTEQDIIIPALNDMSVLSLPSGLEIIGEEAFAGIVSEAVIIPDNCREIGPNAFADCANLRYVYIPKSVIRIADSAFDGCAKVILDIEQE